MFAAVMIRFNLERTFCAGAVATGGDREKIPRLAPALLLCSGD